MCFNIRINSSFKDTIAKSIVATASSTTTNTTPPNNNENNDCSKNDLKPSFAAYSGRVCKDYNTNKNKTLNNNNNNSTKNTSGRKKCYWKKRYADLNYDATKPLHHQTNSNYQTSKFFKTSEVTTAPTEKICSNSRYKFKKNNKEISTRNMTNNKNTFEAKQTFETSTTNSLADSENLLHHEIEPIATHESIPMTNSQHLTKTDSNTSTLSCLFRSPTTTTIAEKPLDETICTENIDNLAYTEANKLTPRMKVQNHNCAKSSSNFCFMSEIEPTRPIQGVKANTTISNTYTLDFLHSIGVQITGCTTLPRIRSVSLPLYNIGSVHTSSNYNSQMSRVDPYNYDTHYNYNSIGAAGKHGSNNYRKFMRSGTSNIQPSANLMVGGDAQLHQQNLSNLNYPPVQLAASSYLQKDNNMFNYENSCGGDLTVNNRSVSNHEIDNSNNKGNNATQHFDANQQQQQYQAQQPILRYYKNNQFQQHPTGLCGNELEEGPNSINAMRNVQQMEYEQGYGIQQSKKSQDRMVATKSSSNSSFTSSSVGPAARHQQQYFKQNQWEQYNTRHGNFPQPSNQNYQQQQETQPQPQPQQQQQHAHNQNFYNLSYMKTNNNNSTYSMETPIMPQDELDKNNAVGLEDGVRIPSNLSAQMLTKNVTRQNIQPYRFHQHNNNRRNTNNNSVLNMQPLEIEPNVPPNNNCDSDCSTRSKCHLASSNGKFKRRLKESNALEKVSRLTTMPYQENKNRQTDFYASTIDVLSKNTIELSENENLLNSQLFERSMCNENSNPNNTPMSSAPSNASISPRVFESIDGTHLQNRRSSSTCSSASADPYTKSLTYMRQDQEKLLVDSNMPDSVLLEAKMLQNKEQMSAVDPLINLSRTISQEFLINAPSDRFLARAHLIEVKEHPSNLLNNSKWDNLSRDIWTKFVNSQQTEKTFRLKMKLWRDLYILIKKSYPRYGLYLVGSTISGFGADTSDADMCLISRSSGVSDPRTEALLNLNSLRDCLMKSGYFEEFNLIEAKVPILRFRDRRNKLEVDLNYNNSVGIKNTHLLHCYSQLDWRVRPLTLVVKLWAQYHNINNAKNMTISSYSLVLMVIHFLQYAVDPPVLPCLHKIFPEKFTLLGTNEVGHVDLNESMSGTYESRNTQTLGELLWNFLDYYSQYNYSQSAISVRTGALIPVHMCRQVKSLKNDVHHWKELCIEEPFDLTNTARSVYDFETFERIKMVFIASREALQTSLNLNDIFSPVTSIPVFNVPSACANLPETTATKNLENNMHTKTVVVEGTDYANPKTVETEIDAVSSNCEIITT